MKHLLVLYNRKEDKKEWVLLILRFIRYSIDILSCLHLSSSSVRTGMMPTMPGAGTAGISTAGQMPQATRISQVCTVSIF